MSDNVEFDIRFVPIGTGPAVWDDPHAQHTVNRFLPPERKHPPMIAIMHMGAVRPTPISLRNAIITPAEDVKVGKYGSCSLFVCSEDEDTRSVIEDIGTAQNIAVYLSSTYENLKDAEPVGDLTARDYETLCLVSAAGGTVSALRFAEQAGIGKTAAGNRLASLHKKGFVLRVDRPHPVGDLFVDPRSLIDNQNGDDTVPEHRELIPNRTTIEAIEASRRGEVVELGSLTDVIEELNS